MLNLQGKMEFASPKVPSAGSLFAAYASLSATITLLQQAYYQFVPKFIQSYIYELIQHWFTRPSRSPLFTLVIEEYDGMNRNRVFESCEVYICSKMNNSAGRLKVTRAPHEEGLTYKLAQGQEFSDMYEEIKLTWTFFFVAATEKMQNEKRYFEVTFEKEHKGKVLASYLPFVTEKSKEISEQEKALKLCALGGGYSHGPKSKWGSVKLNHPFTFDKLAMDPESKKAIVDDLDRFVKRKELYRKVGKAWKRGYLLYGPPGTGKSSLIAAMANHLKFDIYDLQLENVFGDSSLRDLMLSTPNKSILVIEDIDCSGRLPNRDKHLGHPGEKAKDDMKSRFEMSLSGLLNFVDGLWSSCGDERIIIFTTNHRDRIDPALLRPGRMDMHIYMGYLTMPAFKVLSSNYLDISGSHQLFGEIQSLIQTVNVTPAEIAEELLRSDDADVALQGVVQLLKRKKLEKNETNKDTITEEISAEEEQDNKDGPVENGYERDGLDAGI